MSRKEIVLREIKIANTAKLATIILTGIEDACRFCVYNGQTHSCNRHWTECSGGISKYFEAEEK